MRACVYGRVSSVSPEMAEIHATFRENEPLQGQSLGATRETLPPNCRGSFRCLADYLEREAGQSSFGSFRPAKPSERVYLIGTDDGPVKIGLTTNPGQRLESLQTGYPAKLKLLAIVPGGRSLERAYHRYFDEQRIHGEWFEPTDDMRREISFWNGQGWKLRRA